MFSLFPCSPVIRECSSKKTQIENKMHFLKRQRSLIVLIGKSLSNKILERFPWTIPISFSFNLFQLNATIIQKPLCTHRKLMGWFLNNRNTGLNWVNEKQTMIIFKPFQPCVWNRNQSSDLLFKSADWFLHKSNTDLKYVKRCQEKPHFINFNS